MQDIISAHFERLHLTALKNLQKIWFWYKIYGQIQEKFYEGTIFGSYKMVCEAGEKYFSPPPPPVHKI